jgi:mRNA-degrading endonuclease toxin of MazEF toxin-antitoxin module
MVIRGSIARGDVFDYTFGSRRVRVLVVSASTFSVHYPVVVLIHDRADGDVPGLLLPLPTEIAGGGTIDLSRIRYADPEAFGHRHGRVPLTVLSQVDQGLRRLLGLS